MASKNPADWVTPERVTRYVAEEIWKDFPYPPKEQGTIVWEYGTVEVLVNCVLHPDLASDQSKRLYQQYLKKRAQETHSISSEALRLVERLTNKRSAFLLMLLGLGNAPAPKDLTKHGVLQQEAALVYEMSESDFERCFETARTSLRDWLRKVEANANKRIAEIHHPGSVTKKYQRVASRFPKVIQRVDEIIGAKRNNRYPDQTA